MYIQFIFVFPLFLCQLHVTLGQKKRALISACVLTQVEVCARNRLSADHFERTPDILRPNLQGLEGGTSRAHLSLIIGGFERTSSA